MPWRRQPLGGLLDLGGKLRLQRLHPVAILAAVPFVALGGGMLMSMPYSLLMPLMPEGEHGALTGLYSLSRGLGVMLGPLLAGVAIQLAEPLFSATAGYAATWRVAGLAVLASLVPLRRLGKVFSLTASDFEHTPLCPESDAALSRSNS